MRYELLLDRLLPDRHLVVINSSSTGYVASSELSALTLTGAFNVPLGTKFIEFFSRSKSDNSLTTAESVSLKLVEIEFFRKKIDSIPAGHNAAVRLEGKGIELIHDRLCAADSSTQKIYLIAPHVVA